MPESYGTSGGVEITDAVIERLADEAERGFDPAKLRPHGGEAQRRPAAKMAQVQLPPIWPTRWPSERRETTLARGK